MLSGGDAGEDDREDGELHVCGWLEKQKDNWIVFLGCCWMKSLLLIDRRSFTI